MASCLEWPTVDRVVVIAGASSGIGRETALRLATRGDLLVLGARRLDLLEHLSEEILSAGGEAEVVQTDVTDASQVDRLVQRGIDRWGRIDVAVANAAQFFYEPLVDSSTETYLRAMDVNFHGTVRLVYAVLPHMMRQGSGHLVFTSTFDSRFGNRNEGAYVASKHAQGGFAEVARRELAPLGISASSVLLGRVDTPMIEDLKVSPVQPKISAAKAADVIVRAIDRRTAHIVYPPIRGRLLLFFNILSPAMMDRVSGWLRLHGWHRTQS